MWKQKQETMRNFTEKEVVQAITNAFDMGALHGVSWGRKESLPHIQKRRDIAELRCSEVLGELIRNQDAKQS